VVDYAPWISENNQIDLLWSEESEGLIDRDIYFDDIEMDQIKRRLPHLTTVSE
jgi:hypothetical protein